MKCWTVRNLCNLRETADLPQNAVKWEIYFLQSCMCDDDHGGNGRS